MRATVVVENFAHFSNITAEYGLSIHIKDEDTQILMDTGQGHCLLHNSSALGISLKDVDHLVLSHGHYDHTGGLSEFFLNSKNVPVWAHPEINVGHTKLEDGRPIFVGCNIDPDVINFSPVEGLTQICGHVWALEIPMERRDPAFLNQPGYLVVPGQNGWEPDPFPDDISLVVEGGHGLSIILGCSHAGVVNILEEASSRFATRKFYSVIGGMHLGVRSEEYNERVITQLVSRFKVQKWKPCHCTGLKALVSFASKADDVSWAGGGTIFDL